MGFHSVLHTGHNAYKKGNKLVYYVCHLIVRIIYQCDISLKADIDETAYFGHSGFGIVVNPRASIGGGTSVQHCVTIGEMDPGGPAPVIGKCCYIGARAIILGDVHVGDGAKIGAGAVVLSDIPDGCTAVGVPARIVKETND